MFFYSGAQKEIDSEKMLVYALADIYWQARPDLLTGLRAHIHLLAGHSYADESLCLAPDAPV